MPDILSEIEVDTPLTDDQISAIHRAVRIAALDWLMYLNTPVEPGQLGPDWSLNRWIAYFFGISRQAMLAIERGEPLPDDDEEDDEDDEPEPDVPFVEAIEGDVRASSRSALASAVRRGQSTGGRVITYSDWRRRQRRRAQNRTLPEPLSDPPIEHEPEERPEREPRPERLQRVRFVGEAREAKKIKFDDNELLVG